MKNTFTSTFRPVFDQLSRFRGPVKLTHKPLQPVKVTSLGYIAGKWWTHYVSPGLSGPKNPCSLHCAVVLSLNQVVSCSRDVSRFVRMQI